MAVLFPKDERNGTLLALRMPSPLSLSQTDKVGKIKSPQIFIFLVQERQNDAVHLHAPSREGLVFLISSGLLGSHP